MAKFHSEFRNLTLQDGDGVWAAFVDGEFETSDTKIAARLRAADHVSEVKDDKAPAKTKTTRSGS